MRTGKSKDEKHPFGERKSGPGGMPLAPKSLRRKGKVWLSDCSEAELEKAEVK